MVGAAPHVHRIGLGKKHELPFAARVFADDVHSGRRSEQIRAEPVKARYRARALHADGGELGDMVFDCGLVAPGPSGNDESSDPDAARRSFDQKFHAVSRSLLPRVFYRGSRLRKRWTRPTASFLCNLSSARADFSSDRSQE